MARANPTEKHFEIMPQFEILLFLSATAKTPRGIVHARESHGAKPMLFLDQLAERKIAEALAAGEFDNLAGQGMPLQLDDDSFVPEELRSGYRLLKNAGYLPPELNLRREIADIETLLTHARCVEERHALHGRRRYLMLKLSAVRPDSTLVTEARYRNKFCAKR